MSSDIAIIRAIIKIIALINSQKTSVSLDDLYINNQA